MRKIKFRAFRVPSKEMDYNPLNRCDALDVLEHKSIYKDWILMQFTGLKDKNGKEVYESDIVKQGDKVYEIEYDRAGFCAKEIACRKCGTFITYDISILADGHYEIDGNIHENPEPLEKSK